MSPQAGWILQEEVVPRLRSSIPRAVRCVGAEDAEELIQDATVIATRMIIRAETQGKLGKLTPGNFDASRRRRCRAMSHHSRAEAVRRPLAEYRRPGRLLQFVQRALTWG